MAHYPNTQSFRARYASGSDDRPMSDPTSDLDTLWRSVPRAPRVFDPQDVAHLPELARGYLAHAIATGTPLASAVRLSMHGMIRLKRWRKFKAVQIITSDGAMIWRASVRMGHASIRGYDRFIGGEGEMKWRLFGLIPIIREAGPDISHSMANRVAAESIWLPSMLADKRVRWRAGDANVALAGVSIGGHPTELRMTLDHGRLIAVGLPRWGIRMADLFARRPSARTSTRKRRSAATRFRRACASVGISTTRPASTPKASSWRCRSTPLRIAERRATRPAPALT